MHWLVFLPLSLFAAIAFGWAVVKGLVERAEYQRCLRNRPRRRQPFRPVLIQGGKAQAPPMAAAKRESRSA